MFRSIMINNFKSFDNIKLEGLSKINVITGMNNVGKTALLEAIFLLIGGGNPALVLKINTFRGISEFLGDPDKIREAMWRPLFNNLRTEVPINFHGELEDGSKLESHIEVVPGTHLVVPVNDTTRIEPISTLSSEIGERLLFTFSLDGAETRKTNLIIDARGPRVEPPPSPPFSKGYFISSYPPINPREEAELFSQLELIGQTQKILPTLQILEPRLERLAVIISAGFPMIHGDIGLGRMIPLPFMGDGIRRMTKILLSIANCPGGVVLIDDIEFGIHYSNINNIWRSLLEATSLYETQLFITTHSYEWVRGVTHVIQEYLIPALGFFRLERHNSQVKTISYDRESLMSAMKAELEVR
jgi:hypothetical protein